MKQIAVLIPTYNRANKLEKLLRNIQKVSVHATPYFIITSQDKDSQRELERISANYMVFDGEYVAAINHGVDQTEEPWILCGADDIEFLPGWDEKLLKESAGCSIIGGAEEIEVGESKLHISHPLVERKYIEFGLASGVAGKLYFPGYIHYMCDIELCQRGWQNDSIKVIDDQVIKHHNPWVKKNKNENIDDQLDSTYNRSAKNLRHDVNVYSRRKPMFEMYSEKAMRSGLVVPTPLNPEYHNERITIVLPSYNDTRVLLQSLKTIVGRTYYPFDLIIINDSGEWEHIKEPTDVDYPHYINRIELFNAFEMEDQTCTVRVIHNDTQRWVGPNWNLGAELAKELEGNSVFFLNSDIAVDPYWDAYLVAALKNQENKIVCPFQFVGNNEKPYAFDLHKTIKDKAPHMINGACFGMRKADLSWIFPIPDEIKHWGTDSVLADRANDFDNRVGVKFVDLSVIQHFVSVSSKSVEKKELLERIWADACAYENWLVASGLTKQKAKKKAYWIKDVIIERARRAEIKLN